MHVKAAEDSLPCKYVLFLHAGRAFAFHIDKKEKNIAAGPPRKAMGRLQAAMQASVGKQVPRRVARIDVVGLKALGVGDAALIAAVLRAGAHHVGKVDAVVFEHPLQLRFVALEGADLGVDLRGDRCV